MSYSAVMSFDRSLDQLRLPTKGVFLLKDVETGIEIPVFLHQWEAQEQVGEPLVLHLDVVLARQWNDETEPGL